MVDHGLSGELAANLIEEDVHEGGSWSSKRDIVTKS
jgi:hypothetical protein